VRLLEGRDDVLLHQRLEGAAVAADRQGLLGEAGLGGERGGGAEQGGGREAGSRCDTHFLFSSAFFCRSGEHSSAWRHSSQMVFLAHSITWPHSAGAFPEKGS